MPRNRDKVKQDYARILARQTDASKREVVDVLVKSRAEIEAHIMKRAARGDFNGGNAKQNAVLREVSAMYQDMNAGLNNVTNRAIRRGAKEWHQIVKESVRDVGDSAAGMISWTKFDRQYMREYFELLNPYNAAYIAATNPDAASARIINGQVERMGSSTFRELRSTTIDVFRQAATTGMTAAERQKEIMARFGELIGDKGLQAWAFIDASGKQWKTGNYFNMVNRTVVNNVHRRTYEDTLISDEHDLVELFGPIQSNSADACIKWVGRVFSLTGKTPGFPTPQQYIDDGGFHPNCLHSWLYVSTRTIEGKAMIEKWKDEPVPNVERPEAQMDSTSKKTVISAAQPVSGFVPAKTTSEAEEWARLNIVEDKSKLFKEDLAEIKKNRPDLTEERAIEILGKRKYETTVDYGGIDVDAANAFNRAFSDMMKNKNLPQLSAIRANAEGDAMAAYFHNATDSIGELRVNAAFFKRIKESGLSIDEYISQAHKANLLESRNIGDIAHHEAIHYWHRMSGSAELNKALNDAAREAATAPVVNISEYGRLGFSAANKQQEFLAELSVAFRNGKTEDDISPATKHGKDLNKAIAALRALMA